MRPGNAKTLLLTVALGALCTLTGACGKLLVYRADDSFGAGESLNLREANLQAAWIGRPFQELLSAWGAPRYTLMLPGGHRQDEMVVVYGVRNRAAGCVDAFTVYNGTTQLPNKKSEIVNYFCR